MLLSCQSLFIYKYNYTYINIYINVCLLFLNTYNDYHNNYFYFIQIQITHLMDINSFIQTASTEISLDNFNSIYNHLISLRNSSIFSRSKHFIKDLIQLVVDYLIYGDKHDSSFFE